MRGQLCPPRAANASPQFPLPCTPPYTPSPARRVTWGAGRKAAGGRASRVSVPHEAPAATSVWCHLPQP